MSQHVRKLATAAPARTVQRACTACASKESDKPCAVCGKSSASRRESLLEPVQAKLRVNPATDIYEQEADRVADTILASPATFLGTAQAAPAIQTKPLVRVTNTIQRQADEDSDVDIDEDGDLDDEPLQMERGPNAVPEVDSAQEARVSELRVGGAPLSESHRSFFESRFGYDFGSVRVHSDARAAESAAELGARAYTVGHDIVFGAGQFQPGSPSGMHLLAHELTHVVQQNGGAGGAVQRDVLQRDTRCGTPPTTPEPGAIKRVRILLKDKLVFVELVSDRRFSGNLQTPRSTIKEGTYTGIHEKGQSKDCVVDSPGQDWFIDRIPADLSWKAIPPSSYELTVVGTSEAFEADPTDIGKKSKRGKEGEGEGKGVGKEKGTGTGSGKGGADKDSGDKGTKKGTGAGEKGEGKGSGEKKPEDKSGSGDQKSGGGQQGGTSSADDRKVLTDFQKQLGDAGSDATLPPDMEVVAALKELTEAERADLARFLREQQAKAKEEGKVFNPKEMIEYYKNLSPSDRELLRTNLELAKSPTAATELPKQVTIALDVGAEQTATQVTQSVNNLNGALGKIQAMVTHPDVDKKQFDPIDLNKLPVFTEMMMLQGLLAGASSKSPEIQTISKDLMASIGGIRDYVLEEIAWLVAEMAATAIIGALLTPVSFGASAAAAGAEAAWVLKRLNDLRKFLQKVEKIYNTIQKIKGVINRAIGFYDTYKRVRAQYQVWSTRLEKLQAMLEKADAGDDLEEQIEKLEDEMIEELQKSLDDPTGLGAILEQFYIPEDTSEEELKEILFNIPRGIEAIRELIAFYGGIDRSNLEDIKTLSYKAVRAGVLLYPLVGYLAMMVGNELKTLMQQPDLSERLLGIVTRAASKSSRKTPEPHVARGQLKRVKTSKQKPKKEKKKDADDKAKGKTDPKAKGKGQPKEDDDPNAPKKKRADKDDDPKKKKGDKDKPDDEAAKKKKDDDEAAKKKDDEDPKKKAAREKDAEWQLVVDKVRQLPPQFASTGVTQGDLLKEARKISKAHKTVSGGPKITAIPKKGYWKVYIDRKASVGVHTQAEVLMNERARWQQGRKAIEHEIKDLKDDELTQSGVDSKVRWIQDAFKFKTLRVGNRNDGMQGIGVFGAIGAGKEIMLGTIDDLTGLHTGDSGDPIPINWYKEFGNYAKEINLRVDGSKNYRSFPIYGNYTLTQATTGLNYDVRVGIDKQYMVEPGKVLHRLSTPRSGTKQKDYRDALKAVGFNWTNTDADHVQDLGFEGPDDFENLWPLNAGRNRYAFTGKWYRDYVVEYRDPAKPREIQRGSLFALRDKYFKVTKNSQTIPKPGGRTDKKKDP